MESILSTEHKGDKLTEDLNSRCNVFVQVRVDNVISSRGSAGLRGNTWDDKDQLIT